MDRPNIVVINPDQLRWDYLSTYGHPFIETRNIDRLARMGTRFDRAFATCPMCGPSRASLLTGQYPVEHGVRGYRGTLPQSRPNALKSLRDAGYTLGLWGKDHCFEGDPVGSIYHEGENICIGNMDHHPEYRTSYDSGLLEKDSPWNLTERLTDAGLDFIERQACGGAPFFLTLNYQDPHPYFACPEPWASLFSHAQFQPPPNFRREPTKDEPLRLSHWRTHSGAANMSREALGRAMAIYCGQVRYVDHQVGRVLDALEAHGLMENTVVLFWSDHGEFLGDFGVTHKVPAFYECLIRVPVILYDPSGRLPKGPFGELVETIDAMATVLDLCGLGQPEGSRAQSIVADNYRARTDVFADGGDYQNRQIKEAIPGLCLKAPHAPTSFGPGAMLRTTRWKIVEYAEDAGELFDLKNDPHETNNLYDDPEHRSRREELRRRLMTRLLYRGQAPELIPEWVLSQETILDTSLSV